VPYLNITTHLDDTVDQGLLNEKGGSGFPTLFFMEPETGAVLNDWWWPEDEDKVREALKAATAKADELKALMAKAKAAPDDKALQAHLAIKLAMMRAADKSMEELAELAKTEGLDPALKAEFDAWYAGALVQKAYDDAAASAESRKEFMEAAQSGFYELLKKGIRLEPGHESAQMYYDLGLTGAITAGDKEVATVAFEGFAATLNKIVEDNPDNTDLKGKVEGAIADAKKRLDALEETAE